MSACEGLIFSYVYTGEINRRTLGKREKNMVLFIEILLIGVGLSMDAFAVSICKGLGMTKVNRKQALTIGLYFGGFQALMPFIGYMLGIRFEKYITSIDHWIAFILLGFIGGKMVYEAVKEKAHSSNARSLTSSWTRHANRAIRK